MVRRVGAARGGRVLPGLADGLVRVYSGFDKAFCLAQWETCWWCAQLAELKAGRPVVVTGRMMFRGAHDDRNPGRADEFGRDDRMYLVTGDRWEYLPDE